MYAAPVAILKQSISRLAVHTHQSVVMHGPLCRLQLLTCSREHITTSGTEVMLQLDLG